MSDETKAVIPFSPGGAVEPFSAFSSLANFESAQRMGALLAKCGLVPDAYRDNLPNCVIALELASRVGASVLAVVQNLYIVHQRPAWSSQFLISCVNTCGKFSPLRYSFTGEPGTDARTCVAWAVDKSGERLEGPPVSIGMAKAEGWYGRNGSKWQTMPELMLRYRAATFFARTYAPELTMGMHTEEEVVDMTAGADGTFRRADGPMVDAKPQTSDAATRLRQAAPADQAPAAATAASATAEAKPSTAPADPASEPTGKDAVGTPATRALEALESVRLPVGIAEQYLRKTGKMGFTVRFAKASPAVLNAIAADPEAFAREVSAWQDQQTAAGDKAGGGIE